MGYKILDVKADIHEDVEKLMQAYKDHCPEVDDPFVDSLQECILGIVDNNFEKIERWNAGTLM